MRLLKRFWWIFLLGFLAGGGWMLWKGSKAKELKAITYTVKRQDLTETLTLSGEIDALEKADLKFQTSGLLSWVGVKEGDTVKKYQAIASLDKRELTNNLNQYMNLFLKERWDFEQGVDDNKNWQTLGMTDAARDSVKRTLDKNQYDLNNAVLSFEAKNLALKFATLTAPFAGIITKVEVPVAGANITPASAVFSIVNPSSLFFSATADQTEVSSFKEGMLGKVVFDSFPEKEFSGSVEKIGFIPKAGESGTVYELKIAFDPGDLASSIKMGMTGDVNFVLKEIKEVLAVPEAYVKKVDGKFFVSMKTGDSIKKVEITKGETIEGLVEIKSGINENDIIYNQP
ncbi:MAG: Efflux transporter, RND family, MFP subunit [Candidatus Collierbacteria bacterium GW2011_GWB1_45_35]|uniref:Efflux transporter, RND family, MFP subunit n=2 Tax=Candidatus Collieribacteriota TaxID=1752725 RepID=A0A0G1KRU9_9BACT|nr:MAG: Efflux transporter, RND family, MFP subunit [Microgenomates group bacterium GW2011_GWC1_44_23]KKT86371.1 MAG: Efflux transporter, RND family, MFP subunit [Candidatus Collierbacteria bacterium GW2011_GWA2_44_99]KKT95778.1 MAG: Efflux transporter, RND family, MFP subunit [Candidatus Collierbacteria bacterium GW2011_GWA1_45_15]KKU00278.1 MAG: Efflux transporter, RND family, MFP subunit [Candidatus Collierbacteria bacterium GW2011_GWB2_45_17]KKU05495.1 MAG: Efflux transporter, RND family, M